MSEVSRILIQLDADPQCSTFDSVVAVDAGADVLLRHDSVQLEQVPGLVHGAMFTRSPRKLPSTAIFVGGSNAQQAEAIYRTVLKTFFGPVRVSVAMDASGCNTTSAAAVRLSLQQIARLPADLPSRALVLGSTGAVGQRVSQLLQQEGWQVHCQSRSLERAQKMIDGLPNPPDSGKGHCIPTDASGDSLLNLAQESSLVIAAGAAGVCFFDQQACQNLLKSDGVLVDLNAVPPAGIAAITPHADQMLENRYLLGALTVGNLKMALHKAVIQQLFLANDQQFDIAEIYELAKTM